MHDDIDKPKFTPEYNAFLDCVRDYGALVEIWETVKGEEKPRMKSYFIRKGASTEEHTITDENFVKFRPMTRKERRVNYPKIRANVKTRV